MTYRKPEIEVLGEAVRVIQHSTMKGGSYQDGINPQLFNAVAPAYDLDE